MPLPSVADQGGQLMIKLAPPGLWGLQLIDEVSSAIAPEASRLAGADEG